MYEDIPTATIINIVDKKNAEYLSTAEAARFLGVHPNTIYNYIANGTLTAYRFGKGRNIFILKSEIKEKLVKIEPRDIRRSRAFGKPLYE